MRRGLERRRWALVAVCCATFLLLVDLTIVQVALPRVQSDLHWTGLALTALGLLLMRVLTAGSHWIALRPGLLLAGAGIGLANPAISKTALGVVPAAPAAESVRA